MASQSLHHLLAEFDVTLAPTGSPFRAVEWGTTCWCCGERDRESQMVHGPDGYCCASCASEREVAAVDRASGWAAPVGLSFAALTLAGVALVSASGGFVFEFWLATSAVWISAAMATLLASRNRLTVRRTRDLLESVEAWKLAGGGLVSHVLSALAMALLFCASVW